MNLLQLRTAIWASSQQTYQMLHPLAGSTMFPLFTKVHRVTQRPMTRRFSSPLGMFCQSIHVCRIRVCACVAVSPSRLTSTTHTIKCWRRLLSLWLWYLPPWRITMAKSGTHFSTSAPATVYVKTKTNSITSRRTLNSKFYEGPSIHAGLLWIQLICFRDHLCQSHQLPYSPSNDRLRNSHELSSRREEREYVLASIQLVFVMDIWADGRLKNDIYDPSINLREWDLQMMVGLRSSNCKLQGWR